MSDRGQFTFYASIYESIQLIRGKGAAAAKAAAYDAICEFALYGTDPNLGEMDSRAAIAFVSARPNLIASRRKAESGKKGGNAKQEEIKQKANGKQTESKRKANGKREEATSEKEKEKENEKEKEKEKEYECTPPNSPPSQGDTGFGDELHNAFLDWLAYKKEKRQGYKPTGLKNLISEIRNNAKEYGEHEVAELISRCMACNWQGIMFDRLRSSQKKDAKTGSRAMDSDEEEAIRRLMEGSGV